VAGDSDMQGGIRLRVAVMTLLGAALPVLAQVESTDAAATRPAGPTSSHLDIDNLYLGLGTEYEHRRVKSTLPPQARHHPNQ